MTGSRSRRSVAASLTEKQILLIAVLVGLIIAASIALVSGKSVGQALGGYLIAEEMHMMEGSYTPPPGGMTYSSPPSGMTYSSYPSGDMMHSSPSGGTTGSYPSSGTTGSYPAGTTGTTGTTSGTTGTTGTTSGTSSPTATSTPGDPCAYCNSMPLEMQTGCRNTCNGMQSPGAGASASSPSAGSTGSYPAAGGSIMADPATCKLRCTIANMPGSTPEQLASCMTGCDNMGTSGSQWSTGSYPAAGMPYTSGSVSCIIKGSNPPKSADLPAGRVCNGGATCEFEIGDPTKSVVVVCTSTGGTGGSQWSSGGGTGGAGGGSSMQRCFYPKATINGVPPGFTVWCQRDYEDCHVGEPSGKSISTAGLSLGAPSSCEPAWPGGGQGGGQWNTGGTQMPCKLTHPTTGNVQILYCSGPNVGCSYEPGGPILGSDKVGSFGPDCKFTHDSGSQWSTGGQTGNWPDEIVECQAPVPQCKKGPYPCPEYMPRPPEKMKRWECELKQKEGWTIMGGSGGWGGSTAPGWPGQGGGDQWPTNDTSPWGRCMQDCRAKNPSATRMGCDNQCVAASNTGGGQWGGDGGMQGSTQCMFDGCIGNPACFAEMRTIQCNSKECMENPKYCRSVSSGGGGWHDGGQWDGSGKNSGDRCMQKQNCPAPVACPPGQKFCPQPMAPCSPDYRWESTLSADRSGWTETSRDMCDRFGGWHYQGDYGNPYGGQGQWFDYNNPGSGQGNEQQQRFQQEQQQWQKEQAERMVSEFEGNATRQCNELMRAIQEGYMPTEMIATVKPAIESEVKACFADAEKVLTALQEGDYSAMDWFFQSMGSRHQAVGEAMHSVASCQGVGFMISGWKQGAEKDAVKEIARTKKKNPTLATQMEEARAFTLEAISEAEALYEKQKCKEAEVVMHQLERNMESEFEQFAFADDAFADQFAREFELEGDRDHLKIFDKRDFQFLSELSTYGRDDVAALVNNKERSHMVQYFAEQSESDEAGGLQAIVASMARQIEALQQQLTEVTATLTKVQAQYAGMLAQITPAPGMEDKIADALEGLADIEDPKKLQAAVASVLDENGRALFAANLTPAPDVDPNKWYASVFAKAKKYELMQGEGDTPYLNPPGKFNFAQLAMTLAKATDAYDKDAEPSGFGNWPTWAQPAVASLQDAGYDLSFLEGHQPGDVVTRAEFADGAANTILADEVNTDASVANRFTDISKVTPEQRSAIALLVDLDVVDGVGGEGSTIFAPEQEIDRAAAAKMLSLSVEAAGLVPEEAVQNEPAETSSTATTPSGTAGGGAAVTAEPTHAAASSAAAESSSAAALPVIDLHHIDWNELSTVRSLVSTYVGKHPLEVGLSDITKALNNVDGDYLTMYKTFGQAYTSKQEEDLYNELLEKPMDKLEQILHDAGYQAQ